MFRLKFSRILLTLAGLQYLSLYAPSHGQGVLAQSTNLTSFVNLFIGTASGANGGSGGNAFPGEFFLSAFYVLEAGADGDGDDGGGSQVLPFRMLWSR